MTAHASASSRKTGANAVRAAGSWIVVWVAVGESLLECLGAMSHRPFLFAVLSLLVLNGCKDREITAYRAPKDPAAAMPGAAAVAENSSAGPGQTMAGTAVPTASGAELTWTAPAHWTAKPTGAMRKGSFTVNGEGAEADVSITAFPGSTGGLLANLNRWRGQVGLTPLTEAELEASLVHVDAGELHLVVVDFAGNAGGKPVRLLGAVMLYGSDTWFFKLLGPDSLVAHEKPAFLEFLHTVRQR